MENDDTYVQGFDDNDSDQIVEDFGSAIEDIGKGQLQSSELLSSGGFTLSGAFASLCLSTIVCLLSSMFY